ncbi:exopolysaccharide biosynthesis polyprenyl glycosylphosphotransferase [Allomuricauda ruestringensis DSM 13258]|uniref:Exopolysaccharide biosynthesis polyprenyl glycosylphosphotransferase n=1 Tax=Allomuricauda ruestringensis (strain DSM 13258 / CIP 107369 / LMG 19739 / B1) TaxID=886377 RepID=G2PPN2_ALLRU|nr:exopolysaccharide biosynthesis polyprenyl glycosylphosphotransferase [Allomuricauda ruestringensis]AEM70413.1 exopolysaccharide biosynthesis polyprenyl glycosylphosphotransferase [Allomuricauda ruestringensis DSM 13258]
MAKNISRKTVFGYLASYLLDLIIINILAYYLPIQFKYPILFHSYISLSWVIIAYKIDFYEIHRYNKAIYILGLLVKQFPFFFITLYAFIGFFKQYIISRINLGLFFIAVFLVIGAIKFIKYLYLRNYWRRAKTGLVKAIIIGNNAKTVQLSEALDKEKGYGYKLVNQFSPKQKNFKIEDCFSFVVENNIDEIFCSIKELSDSQVSSLIDFSDKNFVVVKFVPDNKRIFSKKLNFEYFGYLPILSLKENPLTNKINYLTKRGFDIVFSLFVIVFLLSWFTPLMAIIIRLESKGPIFFRQYRKGSDFNLFACYKFRSMAMNKQSDQQQATKNDMRITRVGKFIRKTSIDELPQFYNVLMGNMSVVGPRPLLIQHTNDYMDKVSRFMVRHHVKPGITGLAQVKGYRGEIEQDLDMVNRVRFDVFYVENWSLLLDFKIIVQTVINVIKGEEKAY